MAHELAGCAVAAGDEAHRQSLRRVRFRQLGDDRARRRSSPWARTPTDFYDTLVQKLSHDTRHVEHIQDFWGDPLTAGARPE